MTNDIQAQNDLDDTGERLIPAKNNDSVVYGEHISRYLSVIDIIRDKVVLDIACGSGYGSQLLSQYAKSVTGIDNSKEAVSYAKNNYPSNNLTYLKDDAEKLSNIESATMDVVVSMETIEHLRNPEQFVKQVKRVMKPEGIFIVSTPNDNEYREGNEFHLHEFTLVELKLLMKKYFKKSEYYYQGNALAATLFNEKEMRSEFRNEMLVEKSISVQPEKAIYFIVIAKNGKKSLPRLTPNIAISQHWNTKGFIEWNQEREKQMINEINTRKEVEQKILNIESSKMWSYLQRFQAIKKSLVKAYRKFNRAK